MQFEENLISYKMQQASLEDEDGPAKDEDGDEDDDGIDFLLKDDEDDLDLRSDLSSFPPTCFSLFVSWSANLPLLRGFAGACVIGMAAECCVCFSEGIRRVV